MNKQRKITKSRVKFISVSIDEAMQRIDNFLFNHLKGIPKSHIYRLLRKGAVRVNKKRIDPFYKLKVHDVIRIPPLFLAEKAKQAAPSQETLALLKTRILYEDENLLVINKPAGMSVHGGKTVRIGIIEAMRYLYPKHPQIELAHRLDADTSGCLMIAKKKRILRELHMLLREGLITKRYSALVKGIWTKEKTIDLPLQKNFPGGEKHMVKVSSLGKCALTIFYPQQRFKQATLVEVKLLTGRTHQIRVHAASENHPIAGDLRYGDLNFNKEMRKLGLKRMFLHASAIDFILPSLEQHIKVVAPLDDELDFILQVLKNQGLRS